MFSTFEKKQKVLSRFFKYFIDMCMEDFDLVGTHKRTTLQARKGNNSSVPSCALNFTLQILYKINTFYFIATDL